MDFVLKRPWLLPFDLCFKMDNHIGINIINKNQEILKSDDHSNRQKKTAHA